MPQPKTVVDGRSIIPDVVKAAIGGKTFKQATKPLSEDDRELLSRGLSMDVDEWRKEFGKQLRETGSELLLLLKSNLEGLKPGEMAYTLAVLADKAQALEGRNQTLANSINQTVNNYYMTSKDGLLDSLDGRKPLIPATTAPQETIELQAAETTSEAQNTAGPQQLSAS